MPPRSWVNDRGGVMSDDLLDQAQLRDGIALVVEFLHRRVDALA
jgi:hypothetical protein